jgi:hypothetical protein
VLAQFRGDGIVGTFFVPDHRENPPALSVEVQLKNIDAAFFGFAVSSGAFVAAEDGGDVAEAMDDVLDLMG